MTTYMLAATAVTWVGDEADPNFAYRGWVPVAFRGPGLTDPAPVTDPFTGPVGYDNAVVYARTTYWRLDNDGTLSLHQNSVLPVGMAQREIPVLNAPEALAVRHCYGCKSDVPGSVEDCATCAADHAQHTDNPCCEYEPDLSDPYFKCPACNSEDVVELDRTDRWNTLEITDAGQGTVAASLGDPGDFDGDGLLCTSCHSPLALPGDYEIVSWT